MNWVQINIQGNEDFRYMKSSFTWMFIWTQFIDQLLFTTTRFSSVLSCEDLLKFHCDY